jgi:phosphoribosylanthranilate isomerase
VAVKVKICGVRTPAILDAVAEEGADFVGLVFYPKSPRHLALDQASALRQAARGKIKTVAVLVDPGDRLIDDVVETVQPDWLQLHGSESPERVADIKSRASIPIIKAIAVSGPNDVLKARRYAGIADTILFDAKADAGAAIPGGNGVPFDWRALEGFAEPFALSGGLTPDIVGEAIRITGTTMVDVSSGVERAPGEKDPELVRRFIRAAKAAAPRLQVKAS